MTTECYCNTFLSSILSINLFHGYFTSPSYIGRTIFPFETRKYFKVRWLFHGSARFSDFLVRWKIFVPLPPLRSLFSQSAVILWIWMRFYDSKLWTTYSVFMNLYRRVNLVKITWIIKTQHFSKVLKKLDLRHVFKTELDNIRYIRITIYLIFFYIWCVLDFYINLYLKNVNIKFNIKYCCTSFTFHS